MKVKKFITKTLLDKLILINYLANKGMESFLKRRQMPSLIKAYYFLRDIYSEEATEIFQTVEATEYLNRADCDDQTIYMAALLKAKNLPVIYKIVLSDDNRNGHIFVATMIKQRIIYLDPLPHNPFNNLLPYKHTLNINAKMIDMLTQHTLLQIYYGNNRIW